MAGRLRRRVLDYLTPKERTVLLLRRSGMTNRQIVAAFSLSPACVGMRLYRALGEQVVEVASCRHDPTKRWALTLPEEQAPGPSIGKVAK